MFSNDQSPGIALDGVPDDLSVNTRRPPPLARAEDSLEIHAARLLLLIKLIGGRKARIVGRTKLAKLDFFLRYPVFLQKAARVMGVDMTEESSLEPESHMIRYKYGPWDPRYYNVFALLIAKGLLSVVASKDGDVFQLTKKGEYAAAELDGDEFRQLIARCQLVGELFGAQTGTAIKNFIYEHFPEIVAHRLGEVIGD